jgi:hypothetical protein
MSTIYIRKVDTDPEAVLIVDGEDVPRDAQVTLPAWAVAALAYGHAQAAAGAVIAQRTEAPVEVAPYRRNGGFGFTPDRVA